MVFPLLAVLVQASLPTAIPPVDIAARPVRVWLGTTGPLVRGQSVQIFVQAEQDGDLIVLHRRTDGRIEVLFPSNPAADPFVRSGTYEIRGGGNRSAWVVSEPDGSGMVLAALSVDRLRFDEFVHEASWNSTALIPSWNDANAEGALSDIVQRMLGDGAFNYDLVTYTVAPPIYAQQPGPTPEADTLPSEALQQQPDTMPNYASYPLCLNCTFIGYEEIVIAPQRFGARHAARQDEGICGIHTSCAESQKTHAIALARPAGPAPITAPRSAGEPIPYRSRVPATGPVASAARRTRVASAPLSHVRYTALSAPESEQRVVLVRTAGEARAPTNEQERRGLAPATGGVTGGEPSVGRGSRGGAGGAGGAGGGAMAMSARAERRTATPSTPRRASALAASSAATAAPSRGIALPPAAFQGAQSRVPVNRAIRRR